MNGEHTTLRYSDEDLAAFKIIVEEKLQKAFEESRLIEEELHEMNTNESIRFDSINESNLSTEREYLTQMLERQQRFLRDLQNALLRIQNKTYGICSVTGELIDKRRLQAVPHTTKSIQAKLKQ
jgi:DnaK suppressor protein